MNDKQNSYDSTFLTAVAEQIETGVRKAAEIFLESVNITAEVKTDKRNVVTMYDLQVQNFLVQFLREKYPACGFICEETIDHYTPSTLTFVIDPIDGTMNFVHGFNHSCISVGCIYQNELCIGIVYNPFANELFSAIKGCGALLNGKKISVTEAPLNESIICIGTSPYYPELTDITFRAIRKAFDLSLDIRRQGSAALDLCSVAAGRAGLYIEYRISPWDYAAGCLIAEEAGGICTDMEGTIIRPPLAATGIVCGNPKNVCEFLKILQEGETV